MNKITIKLNYIAHILILSLTMFNEYILSAWLLGVIVYSIIKNSKSAALEGLILIQFRSLLNPSVAIPLEGLTAILKFIAIFTLSLFVILTSKKTINKDFIDFRNTFLLFVIVIIIASLFISSYPIVSFLKILSYSIPFYAIFVGVLENECYRYNKFINFMLFFLIITGLPLYFFSYGYTRNGYTFQGLFNHPNVYGSMLVLCFAYYFNYKKQFYTNNFIMIVGLAVLILQSKSRTSMFAFLVLMLLFIIKVKLWKNKIAIIYFLLLCICVFLTAINYSTDLLQEISLFIFKGDRDTLLYSRENQFMSNISRFYNSPLFGTGFNVPFIDGYRSFEISFDRVVENGNIILALLGDTGIVGMILFVFTYYYIFKLSKDKYSLLFWAPFLISLGEMSFFSTNNFGIILYFCFAISATKKFTKA